MNNILGLVFCTSILDFKSYRLAKSRFGNFQDPAPKIDKIPFYASITSTSMLVPYIFMAIALGNFISNSSNEQVLLDNDFIYYSQHDPKSFDRFALISYFSKVLHIYILQEYIRLIAYTSAFKNYG